LFLGKAILVDSFSMMILYPSFSIFFDASNWIIWINSILIHSLKYSDFEQEERVSLSMEWEHDEDEDDSA
jgi:hypothetical protein